MKEASQDASFFSCMETPLKIYRLNAVSLPDAAEVPSLLARQGVPHTRLDTLNWPGRFPCLPETVFAVAWTPEALLLHYAVREQGVVAQAAEDHGKVWEDACVECFVRPEGAAHYYNIECNCIGALHMAAGTGRPGRVWAPDDAMQSVRRWASLGGSPIPETAGETRWEVALVVPWKAFFLDDALIFRSGSVWTGNFYKCGGRGPLTHYVTWHPVSAPAPDFHRPECFGPLIFG